MFLNDLGTSQLPASNAAYTGLPSFPLPPLEEPAQSLAISPNLHALLEYDERIRSSSTERHSRPGTPSSHRSQTSDSVIRRNKRTVASPRTSPRTSLTVEGVAEVEDISFTSLADEVRMDYDSLSLREGGGTNPYINPAPEVPRSRSTSPIVFADIRRVREGRLSLSSSSGSESRRSSRERQEEEEEADSRQPIHWRYLARVEHALNRKRSISTARNSSTQGTHNGCGSTRSGVSSTTWEPSSSPEPHISISSTFYSGSVHSLAFTSMASRPDRGSFIEISSSFAADASGAPSLDLAHPPSLPPVSVSRTDSDLGSTSRKPQIPTTPKPNFNRPGNRTSPAMGSNLSSQARADLVRRTRKLTQMFGQTPHPTAVVQGREASPTLNPEAKWPPHEYTLYMSGSGRRYSAPLTPRELSFLESESSYASASQHPHEKTDAGSPTSFIDLSDDDNGMETVRPFAGRGPQAQYGWRPSLESLTLEQQADEQRRRKRDKLAKLHRFLGSRIPPELALGINPNISLPPLATDDDEDKRKSGLSRFWSSPVSEYSMTCVAKADRLKSELDVEEKAVNVWRAAKMEKVFGIAPPQMLYHTRPVYGFPNALGSKSVGSSPTPTPAVHNFKIDHKGKKTNRPGTAESSQQLIPKNVVDNYAHNHEPAEVYDSYRASLNSLGDIIDRDDRESLERIHEIMHNDAADNQSPLQAFARRDEAKSSSRVGRRLSLPSPPSLTSLYSEYSITRPAPELSPFEVRRRRAVKLTNFFGVSHRDIIDDILESIRKGVEEDSGNGTLNPDQVNDLLQELGKLRNKT